MARPWKIVDLDPSQSLKACLRKIAETRFQETFSYEHETMKGENIEALHDMRVSARRLRAILRIFRESFPRKKYKRQDTHLQTLVRSLGAVREQDVLLEMLEQYRNHLNPQEAMIIDLLISREHSSRLTRRKQMIRELRQLHRSGFPSSFSQFLRESL